MKSIQLSLVLVASMLASSCDEHEQVLPGNSSGRELLCTSFLLGDKDGFGAGLQELQAFALPAGVALPVDWREPDDAPFTDIYPANIGNGSLQQIVYVYEFERPDLNIQSAKLTLTTLGIQDGDSQVNGSDTDLKLYIDNNEVPNAFDDVDQFEYMDGNWTDFVSTLEIEIPEEFLPLLMDGKAEIRWETIQLDDYSQSADAFAIDYCELEICSGDQSPL